MKISILTPTYNRAGLLGRLYTSLLKNAKYNAKIEWLIMDDGSEDGTKKAVEDFMKDYVIEVKYFHQKNQGKMKAINELVKISTGDLIIECDSDDYFTDDAFRIIQMEYEKWKYEKDIYAMCFLKYDQNLKNLGRKFSKEKTTMFDLYFKEGENGEKALVFFSAIRKKYQYKVEENEKFVTEARMYHEMDNSYSIVGINQPIMICEYQKDGYSKNIKKQFKENPNGYYWYFKEIFNHNMKGVSLSKRIYVIKHYVLFYTLTQNKKILKGIKGPLIRP